MLTCIQHLVKFCPFILKVLSNNQILTSKGGNAVTNLRNMARNNPNLGLVNVNVCAKFGEILSINSQDIEGKRK